MNYQSGWVYPVPDSIYNLSQAQSPFASNVSNYFRKPVKVVKPGSRTTSPRNVGRRRTTTSNASIGRTRSVLDKQRANVQHQYLNSSRSRPLSWHPNSYPDFSPSHQDTSFFISNDAFQQQNFYGTTAANGQYTPLTHPVMDEPQIHELITPLEGLSAQEPGPMRPLFDESAFSNTHWLHQDLSKQEYAMDAMFPQQIHLQIPSWHWGNALGGELPTAPSSPSFLPIQGANVASPLDLNTKIAVPSKTDGEELVAMGLYDSPAQVQSSSLLFGSGSPGFNGPPRKRSLKLEEAFEPAEKRENEDQESDADGEDDDDDDGDDHDKEDDSETAISEHDDGPRSTFPMFQDCHSEQSQVAQPWNMAGQTFFFDEQPPAAALDLQHQLYPAPVMSYVMSESGTGLPIQGPGCGWF